MTEQIGSAVAGNPEGNAAPPQEDWKASLPDDIKAAPSLASIKDIPALAKSYVSAQQLIGAKRIALPSEKATPDEIKEFHRAIGVPENVEGYKIELEGADPALLDGFRAAALEAGVPAGSAAKLAAWYDGIGKAAQQAQIAENTKAVEEWKGKLGNKFEEHVGAAKKAMGALGLKPEQVDKFDDMLKATGADGVWGVDILAKLAIDYKIGMEHDALGGNTSGAIGTTSPEAAKAALAEFEKSDEWLKVAFDKSAAGRDVVLAKRQKLFDAAFGTKALFTSVGRVS